MLIRCQNCRALFSLQDGAAASGVVFQVECGRCATVFEARPVAPPRVDVEAKSLKEPPVAPAPRAPDPGVLERKAQADELAKALKPRRPEDDQSALENELLRITDRRRRRLRWALGALSLLALAVLGLGLRARFLGMPREAAARVEKARELLLRDDDKSLIQATALLTEAARMAPGEARPEAERGFAMLLQAAARKDLAERLAVAQRDAGTQAGQMAIERETYANEGTRLLQHGVAAAKAALDEDPHDEAALRALALHAALSGDSDKGALAEAEKLAPYDPWLHYVKAVSSRRSPDAALAELALLRQAEPRLLRAQVEQAALSMDRQEPGPARAVLGQVLQANPRHERARRLLALLPSAPQ